MAQKLIRPNYSEIKQKLDILKNYDNKMLEIANSGKIYENEIKNILNKLTDDATIVTAASIDIEELSRYKSGIRISSLKSEGINNLQDLLGMTRTEIDSIPGIGTETALTIKSVAENMLREIKRSTLPKISIDSLTSDTKDIIKNIYLYMHTRQQRDGSENLYSQNHEYLSNVEYVLKPAQNGLKWIFTSKEAKENAVSAAEEINFLYDDIFPKAEEILDEYSQKIEADESIILNDFEKNSAMYYAELEKLAGKKGFDSAAKNGMPKEMAEEIDKFPLNLLGLNATLRNYQEFGTKYILNQKRSLLGDEMGLGKTMQAIAAFASLYSEGKKYFMVVCPASILVNWCREIEKFSEIKVIKVHGNIYEPLDEWIKDGGVAVTTYETISRFELPVDLRLDMLVADEAHYVKNPEAIRTKALLKITEKSDRVLFMTGTPIENKVDEMCFLISCLQKELADKLEGIKYMSAAEQFREKLAPVYLRRTREDVLKELPELIETEEWCEMTSEELKKYKEAVREGNFMTMRRVSWNVEDITKSSKASRLKEICDEAAEDNRKIIIFSFFRDTIQIVQNILGDRCIGLITGSIPVKRRQEIIDEFVNSDPGTVLVSQVQAGGVGLNIQTASVVIFCEPQIKPSIENQAISRCYRMGQVRSVQVYRLLAEDSIDERIIEILREKQEIFDNFADESVIGTENLNKLENEAQWSKKMIQEERERLGVDETLEIQETQDI